MPDLTDNFGQPADSRETIQEILRAVRRNVVRVVFTTLVCLMVGYGLTLIWPTKFESQTKFRMRDPQRYRLFDRLEEKVVKGNQVPEMVEELHKIRASNFERLTLLIKGRISEGKLEDVPPYFHYCAAWALVHGAVALYHSPFWSNVLEDQEGFFQFLMDIGVRMGNKRKHSSEPAAPDAAPAQTPAT